MTSKTEKKLENLEISRICKLREIHSISSLVKHGKGCYSKLLFAEGIEGNDLDFLSFEIFCDASTVFASLNSVDSPLIEFSRRCGSKDEAVKTADFISDHFLQYLHKVPPLIMLEKMLDNYGLELI